MRSGYIQKIWPFCGKGKFSIDSRNGAYTVRSPGASCFSARDRTGGMRPSGVCDRMSLYRAGGARSVGTLPSELVSALLLIIASIEGAISCQGSCSGIEEGKRLTPQVGDLLSWGIRTSIVSQAMRLADRTGIEDHASAAATGSPNLHYSFTGHCGFCRTLPPAGRRTNISLYDERTRG
jgi:hypothetical protein